MADDLEKTTNINDNTFFQSVREIESAEQQKDTAVGKLRSARKKAEQRGIDLKTFDFVRKIIGLSQPELLAMANNIILYAKLFKAPVFGQLDMFEQRDRTEEELLREAYDKGIVAAKRNKGPDDNPWTLDTPMGQHWERGRNETLSKVRKKKGDDSEE